MISSFKKVIHNDKGGVSVQTMGIIILVIGICACLFLFGDKVLNFTQARYAYHSGTGWERFDDYEGAQKPEEEVDSFHGFFYDDSN